MSGFEIVVSSTFSEIFALNDDNNLLFLANIPFESPENRLSYGAIQKCVIRPGGGGSTKKIKKYDIVGSRYEPKSDVNNSKKYCFNNRIKSWNNTTSSTF